MTRLELYLNELQRFGIRPGLERIRAVLQRLGNPQNAYPIVLVGGTNGKGSTCEFLARMLSEERRVGLYTSPHLYHWNERVRILPGSGELFAGAISDAELDALFDEILPHLEAVAPEFGQPTEFETLTALGFWHFARQNVDAAVIEVGLGGKWDATNVCEPLVSVITHVALDHCDRLGNTVEAIARDKIEIARAHRILVTAETKPEVLQIFRDFCAPRNIHIRRTGAAARDDFQQINLQTAQLAREVFDEASKRILVEEISGPVILREPPATEESPLGLQDARGFFGSHGSPQNDSWPVSTHPENTTNPAVPGRFETIRQSPQVILDGANNPDGAAHLAAQLRRELKGRRLILVLGILEDKDFAAMIEVLTPLASIVIATQSNSPRAAPVEMIAEIARRFCLNVEAETPVQKAVWRALELSREDDVICICGSFYTLAEADRDEIISYRKEL